MVNPPWIAENIIVTLDFDGCIAIGDHVKIKYARILHGINLKSEQCSKEYYPYPYPDKHLMGLTKEQKNKLPDEDKKKVKENAEKYLEMVAVASGDKILEHNLDPQCKKVLNSLYNQGFRFAIITSREGKLFKACKKFIRYHGLPIINFHGTGRKEIDYISKGYFVKKLKARAMIDDISYKLEELVGAHAHLFFLVRPWSESELPHLTPALRKRITVIKDWREFYNGLMAMKELHEAICYHQGWKNDYKIVKDIFNFWWDNTELCKEYVKKYKEEVKAA